MSIRKRVNAMFVARPERTLTALHPELQHLKKGLQRASESTDPLTESDI